MLCKKCGNELKDEAKFCDKCGKKIRNQEGAKKKNKLLIIVTSIILITGIIIAIVVINKNKNEVTITNTKDLINTSTGKELINSNPTAMYGATYFFTLDDVKKSMDKTCKDNNLTPYPNFYDTNLSETEEIYETFKDENNGSTHFSVKAINGSVFEIRFSYTDEMSEFIKTGGDEAFFNILKDVYDEKYANEIKNILGNLTYGYYAFYNNTLCYKERYDNFGMTEYSISAISNECYADMLKNYPENFESTENKLNENTIDRTTFINNLTVDDKEYIKKYLKSALDLTNDNNFVEDRIEIVGNELVYIYLFINLPRYGGATIYSELYVSYYSIMPITDIPQNWKELDFSTLSMYFLVGALNGDHSVHLSGTGLTDEQVNSAISEVNPKIETTINEYRKLCSTQLVEDEKRHLLNNYLEYTKNHQSAIPSEFDSVRMKIKQNVDNMEYYYMKEISESKTLFVKFYGKSTMTNNYKENDIFEYCAMGVLIDINYNNIPLFIRNSSKIISPVDYDGNSKIEFLIMNNSLPEISNSCYVVTPIKKEITKGNTYNISNEFINYICSYFGV